jgi:tetratricopeptide (TPR) repeat protein
VYRTLGNFSAAQEFFNEALALYQDMGDRHGEALTRYQLGFLHTRLGEFDTAITLLETAMATLREFADYWALGNALIYYGWTLYESGELRLAKTHLEEVLKIQRDTQQEVKRMESVAHLGRVALALHDFTLADTCVRWATDFIANRSTLGIEHPAMIYLISYQVLRAKGKFEAAQAMLARGQEYLNDQLAQMDDLDLQQSYIQNIPENRYIFQTGKSAET